MLKLEPHHAPAHYQLALAQLQAGNIQQAKAELKEATSLAPNFAEAVLALAQLNLQREPCNRPLRTWRAS